MNFSTASLIESIKDQICQTIFPNIKKSKIFDEINFSSEDKTLNIITINGFKDSTQCNIFSFVITENNKESIIEVKDWNNKEVCYFSYFSNNQCVSNKFYAPACPAQPNTIVHISTERACTLERNLSKCIQSVDFYFDFFRNQLKAQLTLSDTSVQELLNQVKYDARLVTLI